MEYKVTLKVEYKSGRYSQLNWIEKNAKFVTGEGEKESRRPATAEELENSITSSLVTLMKEKEIRTFPDTLLNKTVIIDFADVSEVEVTVKEVLK
ncbi:hypothetical protein ACPA0F_18095 [Solibacillus silvestris]